MGLLDEVFGEETRRPDSRDGLNEKLDRLLRGEQRTHAALTRLLTQQEALMALEDDLNNSVTNLAQAFADEHTAVSAELVAIAAALAAPVPTPALVTAANQAIANISAITAKMATDAAALTASIPAATTVPPPVIVPPVVTVPPSVVPPTIAVPPVTAPDATPPAA